MKDYVSQQQLDEAWVYGLIRQESRFIADVKSSAGAAGLMQLMPATARWVAKKMGLKDYRWARVTECQTQPQSRHLVSAARARYARQPSGAGVGGL